jgi:hypothetical protein
MSNLRLVILILLVACVDPLQPLGYIATKDINPLVTLPNEGMSVADPCAHAEGIVGAMYVAYPGLQSQTVPVGPDSENVAWYVQSYDVAIWTFEWTGPPQVASYYVDGKCYYWQLE